MSQSSFRPRYGEHLRQIGRDPKMSDEEHRAFVEKIRSYNSGLDKESPYPPVRRSPAGTGGGGDSGESQGEPSE